MRVVIAFADLAGFTRLTEERGDEEAVGVVERFVESVQHSLPIDARVIKTLGDEVMVVGADAVALDAMGGRLSSARLDHDAPAPRIGIHYGEALYRDGDYYGRDVNQAARVVARAAGGEVLVTRPVVDSRSGHGRPALRVDRRNRPQGLLRADRAVPRATRRGVGVPDDGRRGRASWCARGTASGGPRGRRDALRRARLRLPARRRRGVVRRRAGCARFARQLWPARRVRWRTRPTAGSCANSWGSRSRWFGPARCRTPPVTSTRGRATLRYRARAGGAGTSGLDARGASGTWRWSRSVDV